MSAGSARVFLGALVTLVATALTLVVSTQPAAAVNNAWYSFDSSSCKPFVLYSARGSGEPGGGSKYLGGPGLDLWVSLKNDLGQSNVGAIGDIYPAVPVLSWQAVKLGSSVAVGAANAASNLAHYINRCPASQVIVSGYSQGAMAIRNGLGQLGGQFQSHVKAIVLFGDPYYDQALDRDAYYVGGGSAPYRGVATHTGTHIGMPLASRTVSYCHSLDGICQSDSIGSGSHFTYVGDGYVAAYYAEKFLTLSGSSGGTGGTPPPPSGSVTLRQGPAAVAGYWYSVSLSGFSGGSSVSMSCFDSVSPGGFYTQPVTVDGVGNATVPQLCRSGDGPDHWVTANGAQSNHVTWGASGGGGGGIPGPTTGSISIDWSTTHATWIKMTTVGFSAGSWQYTCNFASGGNQTFTVYLSSGTQTIDNGHTCYDGIPGDQVWVTISGVASNTLAVGSPPPPPPPANYAETVGGNANTWSNFANAGGAQGPTIPAFTTVQIACYTEGFRVADGNVYWYDIASSPWSGSYWVSADAFYNNGATSGSLRGTPFVDPAVRHC